MDTPSVVNMINFSVVGNLLHLRNSNLFFIQWNLELCSLIQLNHKRPSYLPDTLSPPTLLKMSFRLIKGVFPKYSFFSLNFLFWQFQLFFPRSAKVPQKQSNNHFQQKNHLKSMVEKFYHLYRFQKL